VQFRCAAMVAFEAINFFLASGGGCPAQPGKQRLLFIYVVPFATHMKILKRGLYGGPLFASKWPGVRTIRNLKEDVEDVLYTTMAVFQHANRIIEPTVWFCAYLYRHRSAFF
jgi:hypothetical protein